VTEQRPRDLARYLPLSNRERVDESGVTGDWGAQLDALVAAVRSRGDRGDREGFDTEVAEARRRRRVRIQDLGTALAEAYSLDGAPIEVSPTTSGAVALARALSAPAAIRAVVRGRTLRSTDAGWEFGSGPELAGTARELVLFLYGRGPVPGTPRPAPRR
jgi:hypothetical protein